jgi:hypothetical protein
MNVFYVDIKSLSLFKYFANEYIFNVKNSVNKLTVLLLSSHVLVTSCCAKSLSFRSIFS